MNDVAPLDRDGHNGTNPGASDYMGNQAYNRDQSPTADPNWDWGYAGALMRYRHLGNTSVNVLFFDGHVEPRKIGTALVKELLIYPF
jgi:prepilin-type processing-associated H-X9-DG protein